jgi:hypothetical protein
VVGAGDSSGLWGWIYGERGDNEFQLSRLTVQLNGIFQTGLQDYGIA